MHLKDNHKYWGNQQKSKIILRQNTKQFTKINANKQEWIQRPIKISNS